MITIITGHDGTGKSTLCENIISVDNSQQYNHFSNPKNLQEGQKEYFDFLKNANVNENYLCDRFHEGEHVYAPIYRGYESNYLDEIEQFMIYLKHNPLLLFVTADMEDIKNRLKIRGEDFVKEEHYQIVYNNFYKFMMKQKLPFSIINSSKLNEKECCEIAITSIEKCKKIFTNMLDKTCDNCNLQNMKIALPRGNVNAKYMFIGQNPGHQKKQSAYDFNFVKMWSEGKTTDFFIPLLQELNIYLDCWFTNIVLCESENNKINNHDINNCFNNILNQINIIKPEIIFTMGNQAKDVISKQTNLNFKIVNLKHPSYVNRFPNKGKEEFINLIKGEISNV